MARPVENNPEMESSAEQFFIIMGNPLHEGRSSIGDAIFRVASYTGATTNVHDRKAARWPWSKFTVFGEVTEGIEVIDRIAKLQIQGTEAPSKKVPMKITLTQVK